MPAQARRRQRRIDHQLAHFPREQIEAGHIGTRRDERLDDAAIAGDRRHRAAQRVGQAVAGRLDRHLAAAQETVQRVARDEPAIEQRRQRLAQPRLAELGEQQRNVGIVERDGPADRERAVERRFDEARRLGFVGEIESGIDAGFEREFVQQRQAEGVDGADADVVERIADLAPALVALRLPSR